MNAARLKALRIARGLTLEELSAAMGGIVTKQALSKYEHAVSTPTPRVLIALAKALRVKAIDLAVDPQVAVQVVAFRKRASFPKRAQRSLENRVAFELERRVELQGLIGQSCAGDVPLGTYAAASFDDIEAAADELRDTWRLGRDPIGQMVDVLEEHCFHVVVVDAPETFDGVAAVALVDEQPVGAAVAIRAGVCGERQRLSLAHELGHLALAPGEDLDEEKAAYRFGSAFLAPRESLIDEVGAHRTDITSEELFILKQRYGMSVAALVYRLHDLGVISDRYYQQWWRYISRMGWRKHEPQEMPPEEPRWLTQSTLRAFSEGLVSESEVEQLLGRAIEHAGPPSRRRVLSELTRDQRAAVLAKQAAAVAPDYSGAAADSDDSDDTIVDY